MKLLKSLTVGALMATMASHASAYTLIHVVGSTAFRTGTSIAIVDYLAGATAASYTKSTNVYVAFVSGSGFAGAGQQIFADGYIGSAPSNPNNTSPTAATTVIVTDWTGSAGGLVDLTDQQTSAQFLDDSQSAVQTALNTGLLDTSTYLYYNTSTAGGTEDFTAGGAAVVAGPLTATTLHPQIDMSMSDVNKTTISSEIATATLTASIGSYTTISQLANAVKATAIKDAGSNPHVAICPFEWVVGNMNSSAANGTVTYPDGSTFTVPTAMTENAAKGLIGAGYAAQGLFTGGNTNADYSTYFYLVGRNEDSGSRIAAYSEAQYGVTSAPVQYIASTTAAGEYPTATLYTQPNVTWNTLGHSGYNTGGNVASALEIANGGKCTFANNQATSSVVAGSNLNSFYIGYLGLTDAANALANGAATALTYNGYAFSEQAIERGTYTFWSYEHCYRNNSFSGNATAVNTIADLIAAKDADVIYAVTPSAPGGDTQVYSAGFSPGINHAENGSTGVYARGTITLENGGNPVAGTPVTPLVAAGMFDDSFVLVSRAATAEGSPVSHK